MLRLMTFACALAGCGSIFDLEPVKYQPDDDAGAGTDDGDTTVDAELDAAWPCYGAYNGGFLRVCLAPGVDDAWVPTNDIDTSGTDADCEQIEPTSELRPLCILAAPTINISSPITVHGARPLVLVATSSLTLTSHLLVNSTTSGPNRKGPGANPTSCGSPIDGQSTGFAGGGGAGGTYGTRGGNGGRGDGTQTGGGIAPSANPDPAQLRGGCAGGSGGYAPTSGGNGGGAVYVISPSITIIAGRIDASGAAGEGGGMGGAGPGGGGGGGSGGMIILDAQTVDVTSSIVIALGGGGGGGAGDLTNGQPGNEVNYGSADLSALGGAGGNNGGGAGGNGADKDTVATGGIDGQTGKGGGGGGGARGVIRILATTFNDNSNQISPALTP